MKVSFFVIVSFLDKSNKSEKFHLSVKRGIYMKMRKKLFKIDRKKNKGKTSSLKKVYPVLILEKNSYVVYGAIKLIRIEDIKSLDLSSKNLR